jgi:hypothetical protein
MDHHIPHFGHSGFPSHLWTKDCHSGVTLKRAQILHALHMALRSISLEALEDIETEKQKKAMDDLLAQKALVEEHFLLIVQANKGDVERATNFATLYHRSLSSWLDHEVTQLAADVRSLAWLLAWLGLCWDVPKKSDLMISLLKLDEIVTNHHPHHLTFAFPR